MIVGDRPRTTESSFIIPGAILLSSDPSPKPNDRSANAPKLTRLIALVKPFRARAVLTALESVEIVGGTVREVMGFGRQKHQLHRYLGSEYNASFLPKVEIELFVAADQTQAAIKAIVASARTGRMGDGKILVLPCHDDYID